MPETIKFKVLSTRHGDTVRVWQEVEGSNLSQIIYNLDIIKVFDMAVFVHMNTVELARIKEMVTLELERRVLAENRYE